MHYSVKHICNLLVNIGVLRKGGIKGRGDVESFLFTYEDKLTIYSHEIK